MTQLINELETLRRTYEKSVKASASLEEAIERGWTQDDPLKRQSISEDAALAETTLNKLEALIKDLKRSRSTVVTEWVSLHLETCLRMLNADVDSDHEKRGVRCICLSDVLQGSARLLQSSAKVFTVNSYYLPDYYSMYETVVAGR